MHVTARVEYALRALLALAAAEPSALTAHTLADTHGLPLTFLQSILGDLRRADLVYNQRLPRPGYRLARAAEELTVGEVLRLVSGARAEERAEPPAGEPSALVGALRQVWQAADTAQLEVINAVTLADLRDGRLPEHVRALLA